jgi:hypothetical protein
MTYSTGVLIVLTENMGFQFELLSGDGCPFSTSMTAQLSAQVLANITLPVRIVAQLITPVQRCPLGLLLEEPHGVDVLESHASTCQQMHPQCQLATPISGMEMAITGYHSHLSHPW